MSVLKALAAPERRATVFDDLLVLLPDTSTGTLPGDERLWLNRSVRSTCAARRLVITHYPLDRMAAADRAWLTRWLLENGVELLAAGHSHFHRTRRGKRLCGGCGPADWIRIKRLEICRGSAFLRLRKREPGRKHSSPGRPQ